MTRSEPDLGWELAAMQLIDAVARHQAELQPAWDRGLREFLATAVDLEDASAEGLAWHRAHTCSDAALDAAVGRLFASQSLALGSFALALRRPPVSPDRIEAAEDDIVESMVAVAESLGYLRSRLPIP